MKKTPTILESPDLVAFIWLHQNTPPRPFLRQADRRVCFEFTEDVIHQWMHFIKMCTYQLPTSARILNLYGQ